MNEIVCRNGRDLAREIRVGRLSCREVMLAHLERIDAMNPRLNAIVSMLKPDVALALADAADRRRVAGEARGPLFGLPMAVKDLVDVEGFPTTSGSPLFAERMATRDSLLAARLRSAGALIIGKTNTPEFGLGSHTFNPVHGVTRNPHDPSRSAGGSSGGAGAALASYMLPLADGSDMGGSLRNPGSFNGVVGFRPSIGRVPGSRSEVGWMARIATEGPMGRTVADTAYLLSVLAGPDASDPLSLPDDPLCFAGNLDADMTGTRIAWTPDFDIYPVAPEVRSVAEAALSAFAAIGAQVEARHPDASGAMEVFKAQRAAAVGPLVRYLEDHHPDWRERVKAAARWNFEQARTLTLDELLAAELERTRIFRRFARFFDDFDFLALPTVQVEPFPVEVEYPTEIDGVEMGTYLDWMASCCVVSITGLPAISVPCGRTRAGLPVGLQIVGPPRADLDLLRLAHAFEAAVGYQGLLA